MSPFRLARSATAANDDRAPTFLGILADVATAMRAAGLEVQRTRDHGPAWFHGRTAYGLRLLGIEDGVPVFAACAGPAPSAGTRITGASTSGA
ncbi:hypothetical protein JYK14_24540 [Siccirubricoccus sp. KC 17139]|uniref:Uncharacterized protein n=1 Tax=Siccirubricoccus soli TaxID=2899147 RepID=A0ABT1DBJ6_9PROT|nr:hypothetical protein [Siccirubricoccus soli]MCO6419304.1 hypothetical protein [Siccirubricoccus soli]MCP2685439.1 hypothetical protein [Siccirubricoccus soli]